MKKRTSKILNSDGRPFTLAAGERQPRELDDFGGNRRAVRATYDAARTLQDTANHWADADACDADSANSRPVRERLVQRSRYECANNGYSDGIANTYATDLVGTGPQLRMQTGSDNFNRLIESRWYEWCQAVGFDEKLRTSARAKHVDGEGLGVIRRNPGVRDRVKLDWVLYETEQCQTPYLPFNEPGYIDGIKFDAFGNPEWYDILREHPGSTLRVMRDPVPERIPAKFVTHWFKRLRPGQHRGIPETTSTLNLGAAARRWREASLTTAEMRAKLTVLLKSMMAPADEDADPVTAMSKLELLAGTMLALPNTVEPVQIDNDTPGPQYESFHKTLVNEQARPKAMPYIKAACDASGSNYATGRLDHQGYYAVLDVDRCEADKIVLDVLFAVWFDSAVRAYGWLGGDPEAITAGAKAHQWDWPKHRVVDLAVEAESNDKKLKNGSTTLDIIYTEDGRDREDELIKKAASNGITVDQQRQIDLLINQPQHVIPYVAQILGLKAAAPAAAPKAEPVAALLSAPRLNGAANGHAHQ